MTNKKWNWISFFGILVILVKLISCSGESVKTEYVPISNPATKVEILYEKTSLKVGESLNLHAKVTPENTTDSVTWSSSNPKVATVNTYGVVSAVSEGSVKITVSAGSVSASITLTVEAKENTSIPATQIKINYNTTKMKVGEGLLLYADVTPVDTTDSITWSSSNQKVATVSSYGVVSAISEGSVEITAKAGNVSASVTITVEKEVSTEIPVTYLQIVDNKPSLLIGETFNLSVKVTPANTTDAITWSSSNPKVATVNSNGVVTALSEGTVEITVRAGPLSSTATITVKAEEDPSIPTIIKNHGEVTRDIFVGQTNQIFAYINPFYSTDTILWESSNPESLCIISQKVANEIAEVVIFGKDKGTYTMTVKVGNESDSITVNVLGEPILTYKVLHYKEKLDLDGESKYELVETDTGSGEQGANLNTKEYIKDYANYSLNNSLSNLDFHLSSNDMEVKLYYDRKTYSITFDTDGGSTINSISGKYETTVTAPENPTKKHYIFDGWSPELPSTFTSDVTVKAKWKQDETGKVDLYIY